MKKIKCGEPHCRRMFPARFPEQKAGICNACTKQRKLLAQLHRKPRIGYCERRTGSRWAEV